MYETEPYGGQNNPTLINSTVETFKDAQGNRVGGYQWNNYTQPRALNTQQGTGFLDQISSGIGSIYDTVSNWFGYGNPSPQSTQSLQLTSQVPDSIRNAVNQGTGAAVEFGKPTALGINPQGSSNFKGGGDNNGGGKGNGAQSAAAWGQMALQGLTSYLNYKNGKRQLALEREKFLENKAASHANFKNQAMALNTQYRDQMSGRGYVGMSRGAKRDLGKQYENRKVDTDY